MEEDEDNDIVTYIQDQKYPQNANESVKRKLRKQVLWILLKHCNCNDFYIYLKNTAWVSNCPGNTPKYYPGNMPKYYNTKYHYRNLHEV
jgi:hypothetical protein